MKKLSVLLSTLILLALAISACSSAGENTAVPSETGAYSGAGQETGTPGVLPGTGLGTPSGTEAMGTITSTVATTSTTAVATQIMTTTISTGTAAATSAFGTPVGTSAASTPSGTQAASTPQTGAVPATGGEADTHLLSHLIGFTVVNQNGETLGTAKDYILNLCEAHILYIVLAPDAAAFANVPSGEVVLIPYEAVSVHGGKVSAKDRQIVVDLTAEQLQGAPSFAEADLDLSVVDWENQVVTYWNSAKVNLTLTSECHVNSPNLSVKPAGTPVATAQPTLSGADATPSGRNLTVVHKIAFASQIISTQVQDGNGKLLGQVEDVIVTPETGKLDFVAVRVDDSLMQGSQLVLVPLRALNLPEPGAAQIHLVLLVDTNILKNAPAINDLPKDFSQGWDNDAFDYWSQHVQMTREGE